MKLKEIQTFLQAINNYANDIILAEDGERVRLDSEKYFQDVKFEQIDKETFTKLSTSYYFQRISFLELYKNPPKTTYYVKKDKTYFPITDYDDFNQIFISRQNGYVFKENIRNAFLKLILELFNNHEPEVFRSGFSFCFLFSYGGLYYKLEMEG